VLRKPVTRVGATLAAVVAFAIVPASAGAAVSDTIGQTTVGQRVVPAAPGAYRFLQLGAGEPYTVRQDLATAGAERASTRTSLAYFGQLSDFQLADEESPARLEIIDPLSTPLSLPFGAAWRPWEALEPQIDDSMIRQMNQFAAASPVADGSGAHSAMDFTIDTGDSADSQQLNETQWVRTLLEGGALNPNSGVNKATYSHLLCPNLLVPGAAEAARYTGIQDYDDYVEGTFPEFYDPDSPAGPHAAWPKYPGLMDKAQQSFTAAGLSVPSYVAFGNHDALIQGNAAANAAFELVATGCLKPIGPVPNPENAAALITSLLNPAVLLGSLLTSPQNTIVVPGDPKRQFVSKKQYKDVFRNGSQADGHGFDYIDPAQETASKGAAGYYSWSPEPGMRLIALDTVAEAGTIVTPTGKFTADGNIDDPQFKWLKGQLQAATAADELVVLFSHHAPESLTADAADELAPPCLIADAHGHDLNPGCDLDPRSSQPIHLRPTWSASCTNSRMPSPGSPATRTTTSSTPPEPERAGRVLEHPRCRRGRLAAAEPPAAGVRQPGRHALDLRHDPRPHRAVGGARGGHARHRHGSQRPRLGRADDVVQRPAVGSPAGRRRSERPQRRAADRRPALIGSLKALSTLTPL